VKLKLMISSVFGVLVIGIYIAFTITSYLHYSAEYSPLTNWLSDLGNPLANPSGAVYYNLGCILTSIALVVFFIGLSGWNTGEKKMKILLSIGQITGIFSAFSLIITASFPLGEHTSVHSAWSMIIYISVAFFFTFSGSALLKHPAFAKWIAYWGFLAAAFNFINGAILSYVLENEFFIGEWVTVTMLIVYVGMLVYSSRAIYSQKNFTRVF